MGGFPRVGLVLSQGRGAFLGSGLQTGPDDMVFTAKKWLHASLVWSLPNLGLRTCCGYQAPILGLFTPLPNGKGALVKWFLGHMPRLSYSWVRQKEAATLTLSQHRSPFHLVCPVLGSKKLQTSSSGSVRIP